MMNSPLKLVRLLFALPLLALFIFGAQAEEGAVPEPVIGVLDMQKVLRETKAAASLRAAVDAERKKYDAAITERRAALKTEEEKLRKQKTVLSAEALDKRRRELEREYGELRRMVEQYRQTLNNAFSNGERKIRVEMAKVLAVIMKEKNINLTVARSAVLVFDERLNVTSNVIAELDKALPTIQVTFSGN